MSNVLSFKRFNAELMTQYDKEASEILGKDLWRVMKGFRYYVNDKDSKVWVDVPAGYLMDGASVPRPFWNIIPPWGQYGQAAAVHDVLCEYLTVQTVDGPKRISRKRCDEILNEAMEVLGVEADKRFIIYNAVSAYRVVSGTDEPQLWREKLILEAAWRAKNGVKLDVMAPEEPCTCWESEDKEVNDLINEKDDLKPSIDKLRIDIATVVTKEWIIKDKTAVEAGYVNNPDDPGGPTNHGITMAVANKHKDKLIELFDWDGTMENLPKEAAFWIYDVDYWQTMKLDFFHQIEPLIADKLFDMAINIGVTRVSLWVQRYLNVMNRKQALYPDALTDGVIGKETTDRFEDYMKARGKLAVPRFLMGMLTKQGAHYQDISFSNEKLETFSWGWMARLEHNFQMYNDKLWDVTT